MVCTMPHLHDEVQEHVSALWGDHGAGRDFVLALQGALHNLRHSQRCLSRLQQAGKQRTFFTLLRCTRSRAWLCCKS